MVKIVQDAKKSLTVLGKLYSGELLESAMESALEKAKQMVPGKAIISKGLDMAQNIGNKMESKKMSKMAQEHGVSKSVADKAAQKYYEGTKKQREQKRENHLKKANTFQRSFGLNEYEMPKRSKPKKKHQMKDPRKKRNGRAVPKKKNNKKKDADKKGEKKE